MHPSKITKILNASNEGDSNLMKDECIEEKENRYTRLKAIKEFGYDIDWDNLKQYHIGVIGVGGLGVVSSEMAVRCGVGKLTLFDFDKVEEVNLNRSMYKPKHIGLLKAEVAKKILKKINPDVEIAAFSKDVMRMEFEPIFDDLIQDMDLILNGVDNLPAREYLNVKCVKYRIPYIDAGASRSGLSGYVHPIIPFQTACSACLKRVSIKPPSERGKPCTASLPSTMAILASIQIQEMLKYLLKFGEPINYLMYNFITGEFSSYKALRDKNCLICGENSKIIKIEKTSLDDEKMEDLIKKLEE